jgi:hypothetical protein
MGGFGSGRFGTSVTVEDCRRASAVEIGRQIARKPRKGRGSARRLFDMLEFEADYHIEVGEDRREAALILWFRDGTGPDEQVVRMTDVISNIGQPRWWFRCPTEGCGRRVSHLYQSPDGGPVACRTCLGLSYASRNLSRKGGEGRKAKLEKREQKSRGRKAPARPPRPWTAARLRRVLGLG